MKWQAKKVKFGNLSSAENITRKFARLIDILHIARAQNYFLNKTRASQNLTYFGSDLIHLILDNNIGHRKDFLKKLLFDAKFY